MQSEQQLTIWARQLAILSLLLILAPAGWAGSKYKVLYNFKGGNDGIDPHGNLVFDAAGNLYGTTAQGGGTSACHGQYQGCGIVFQLEPQSSGDWKENVLYSFTNGSTGGVGLEGNLVLDAAGNVYGTAYWGGSDFEGTVFELSPGSNGWTEKDIYAFCPSGCGDGGSPASGVIFDDAGNIISGEDVKVAGVKVPIPGATSSPAEGSATLTDAQAADLAAGKYYINIHTAANPGGEIRGQVTK